MKLTPRLVSDLAPEHALSVVEKLNVSNRGIDGVSVADGRRPFFAETAFAVREATACMQCRQHRS